MLGIGDRISSFLHLNKQETKKIIWLSIAFFCVIGGYTILKEMKDSLFSTLAGADALPYVKMLSLVALIPATLLFAKLVDRVSRYKLLWLYTTVYGIGGIVVAALINNPWIGLIGPEGTLVKQIFGWIIYLFYEGANPFVVSLFWSYANSITPPNTAKNGYAIMISGSKLGGMFTAGIAWSLFSFCGGRTWFPDVWAYQILLVCASFLLWIAPMIIRVLMKDVSEDAMHGYEAAYKVDHDKEEKGKDQTGILSGLSMMGKHPYIFGIFGMIFFYELVNVILGVQRIVIMAASSKGSLAGFSGSLFMQRFIMHGVGFLISFLGTRPLIARWGERICLLLIPVIMSVLLLVFMLLYNEFAVIAVFMALGTLNYAFSSPLRESLYIPTVRDIRFKSKAWIDSFGTKFSKGCGSFIAGVIKYAVIPGSAFFIQIYSVIFVIISVLWITLAWFLGKKYEDLVDNNQVIGSED